MDGYEVCHALKTDLMLAQTPADFATGPQWRAKRSNAHRKPARWILPPAYLELAEWSTPESRPTWTPAAIGSSGARKPISMA